MIYKVFPFACPTTIQFWREVLLRPRGQRIGANSVQYGLALARDEQLLLSLDIYFLSDREVEKWLRHQRCLRPARFLSS